MAEDLKFGQAVDTPKGPGTFIGYFANGHECQISRWTKRDGKTITVNDVFPNGSVTYRKVTVHTKPKAEPVSQVADVVSE